VRVARAAIFATIVASVVAVAATLLAACTDIRGFRGSWSGPRVGDLPLLDIGVPPSATATLAITSIDTNGLTGTLTIFGVTSAAPVQSLASAEADALATLTFSGSPLRVFLAFVPTVDGNGDAVALIALYQTPRVEIRVMRGGPVPLYAIFALTLGDGA
jgi:hypothetical protein